MRRALVTGLVGLVLWAVPGTGRAQETPLPELPEPLIEVVALLEPSVTPVCGTTAVVGAFGPTLLSAAPPEVQEVIAQLGPTLVVLCGAVPIDTGGYRCQLDKDLATLIAEGVGSVDQAVAAIVLTAMPSPARILVNQARNILSLLPGVEAVEPAVAGVFQCAEAAGEEELPLFEEPSALPTPTDAPPPSTPPPLGYTPLPDLGGSFSVPPLVIAPPTTPVAATPPSETVTVVPLAVRTYGFQYAAVLLVPLVLLAGAAYVGGALTRELTPR